MKIFSTPNHNNLAKNATEKTRFAKTYEMRDFFGKKVGLCRKHDFLSNIVEGGKFALEMVHNDITSQRRIFSTYNEFLCGG